MAPVISVVDDDISVRRSLDRLLRSVPLQTKVFASAEEFIGSENHCTADCLILDVRLPGMSGIELNRYLLAHKCTVPVIFITAHGSDESARLEAASDWTVAYLIKPFSGEDLLEAVDLALKRKPGGNQKDSRTEEIP